MKTLWESFSKAMKAKPFVSAEKVDAARSKAEAFMKANPKTDLYPVTFDRPDDDMEICILVPMSQEELAAAERLKEDDSTKEAEDLCQAIFSRVVFPFGDAENPWCLKEIGSEPQHSFEFTAAVFKDRNAAPKLITVGVPLEDEEYTALLACRLLCGVNGCPYSFNRLRDDLPALHDKIAHHIEYAVGDTLVREENPYAVFMDELEKNVEEMR